MKKFICTGLIFGMLFTACNSESTNRNTTKTETNTERETETNTERETESNLPATTTTFLKDSSINILNPDRGLYHAEYFLTKETDSNIFSRATKGGYKLAFGSIFLEDYLEVEILPNDIIDNINKNLRDAEELGVKIILRIKYRNRHGSDPRPEIARAHLAQLKPVLQNHKDIISVVQAGVIGKWGEWHGFTGEYAYDSVGFKDKQREILETLVDIFPDKYIQIRYPMAKELLYGSAKNRNDIGSDGMITTDIAFTDDMRAKLGHHNDCFLADEADRGTYSRDDGPEGIEFWRNYVINDTRYSPVGGETCRDNSVYTNCENALLEFKLFGWSYLNQGYNRDVMKRFKNEGCYQEIKENLGYKLVATKLEVQQDKNNLITSLYLSNDGYAAPYIKSEVSFILRDANNSYEYNQNIDLRTFYVQETHKIRNIFDVHNIEKGTYCLYLKIGKDYSAIRLANKDLWNEESKTNELTCSIVIE